MNEYNEALYILLEKCNQVGATVVFINYQAQYGIVEREDGTPYKILYDEQKNIWR